MNDYLGARGGFFTYYWDQFYPILASIALLIIGWIIALVIASMVKKLLQKLDTNARLSRAINHQTNLEDIISKIVFWIIMIITVIGVLNVLNLNSVSGPFSQMVQDILQFIPRLIAAIAVGFVGWILANVARSGLQGVLNRTQMDEKLSQEVGATTISKNMSEIAYWLILLLFLPIVLSILGLQGLLLPVQNMISDVVSYLPQIFIAGVTLFVGYLIAKILRSIVAGLVESVGLQEQAQKVGLFKTTNLAKILSSFVFAIVMITTLIIAFEALGVTAISQPATAMLNQFMSAIPQIIAAGLILVIAYVVSKFISGIVVDLLAGTGVDELPTKMGAQQFLGTQKVSSLIGCLVIFFTMLFAVSEAANRLGFEQITHLVAMFIQFGANILLGAVILLIGFWLANLVADVIKRGQQHSSKWLANLVRVLIMGLVLAMGLRAMGIADSIVNLAFGLTLGAVAVAFALAVGLGGRKPAEQVLLDMIDRCKKDCNTAEKSSVDLMQSTPTSSTTPSAQTDVTTQTTPSNSRAVSNSIDLDTLKKNTDTE